MLHIWDCGASYSWSFRRAPQSGSAVIGRDGIIDEAAVMALANVSVETVSHVAAECGGGWGG